MDDAMSDMLTREHARREFDLYGHQLGFKSTFSIRSIAVLFFGMSMIMLLTIVGFAVFGVGAFFVKGAAIAVGYMLLALLMSLLQFQPSTPMFSDNE